MPHQQCKCSGAPLIYTYRTMLRIRLVAPVPAAEHARACVRGMTGSSLQYSHNRHRQCHKVTCDTAYFPRFPLSTGNHCCGPLSQPVRQLEAQVPLSKKNAKLQPGGAAQGALGTAGPLAGHGLSRACGGFRCAACAPLIILFKGRA